MKPVNNRLTCGLSTQKRGDTEGVLTDVDKHPSFESLYSQVLWETSFYKTLIYKELGRLKKSRVDKFAIILFDFYCTFLF